MRKIEVAKGKNKFYDIIINNSFTELEKELNELGYKGKKICIVTDSNVNHLFGADIKKECNKISNEVYIFEFPAGEENKTLNTVEKLYEFLIEKKFYRDDLLVALGGGVVGDLTGYTAATYLRGIDYIQIPTTLLSQVDSSIGGKTGVDFLMYKNMVGSFYQSKLVYANISTLKELSTRQFLSGMAEVLKAGLIKDVIFYEWLLSNMFEIMELDEEILEEMIYRAEEIKVKIVLSDPKEKGNRALLNFGHTIGHAIEKYKNFEMLHGECIALGMVAAAYISYQKKILNKDEYYEIRDMFVPFYLPITIEDIDVDEIIKLTKNDKKMNENGIKFVLLKKVGRAFLSMDVTDEELRAGIEEINYKEEEQYE